MSGIYAWATKHTPAAEVSGRVVGHLVRSGAPGVDTAEHEIESVWLNADGVWMADLAGGASAPFDSIYAEWPDRA